jgi:hypothetical protein
MMWIMAIAGLLSCVVGLIITPWISRATTVRGPVMMPVIVSLAVLGSFAAVTGFAGVVELGVFAAVGVVLRKLGYSVAAMTIGLVLGGTFADNVHLTQTIYGWGFITRSPLADIFLVISIALLGLITWRGRRGKAVITAGTPQRAGRGPQSEHPVLEPVTEAAIAVVSVIYMIMALGYGADAGAVPAIIAAIAAVVSLFRLASRAIGALRARASAARQAEPVLADPALAVVSAGPAGLETGHDVGQDSNHVAFGIADADKPAGSGQPGAGPQWSQPPGPGDPAQPEPGRRRRRMGREVAALGWIWAAIAASYLLGFEIGVPVAAAAYCLTSVEWNRRWARFTHTVIVAGVAFAIAYSFVSLFSLTFTGLLI